MKCVIPILSTGVRDRNLSSCGGDNVFVCMVKANGRRKKRTGLLFGDGMLTRGGPLPQIH